MFASHFFQGKCNSGMAGEGATEPGQLIFSFFPGMMITHNFLSCILYSYVLFLFLFFKPQLNFLFLNEVSKKKKNQKAYDLHMYAVCGKPSHEN